MEDKKQDSILLLGMVFAHQALEPKRGQEYRDRVRCQSLQNSRRCKVFTLDDKHNGDLIEEHCQANFADTRRMMQSMKKKWNSSVIFSDIVLDYFFSPVGWARCRWNKKFFSHTLPAFAENGLLCEGGKIWLPNLDCIEEQIAESRTILDKYFTIDLPENYRINPLYEATELVEEELLLCPDILTNETQIRPLLEYSETPFYCLTRRSSSSDPSSPKDSSRRKTTRKISEILDYDSATSTPIKFQRREVKRKI